nr:hypothetical protein [Tanacetum cinerariifolium]
GRGVKDGNDYGMMVENTVSDVKRKFMNSSLVASSPASR